MENLRIKVDLRTDYWYSDDACNHRDFLLDLLKWKLSYQTLIVCFSLEQDCLSQWRAYGKDGKVIEIGFNYNLLKRDAAKLLLANGYGDNIKIYKFLLISDKEMERWNPTALPFQGLISECIEEVLVHT